jgi:hypothetical protein
MVAESESTYTINMKHKAFVAPSAENCGVWYSLICHCTGKRIIANKKIRFVLVPFPVPCSLFALRITVVGLQELRAFRVRLLFGL